MRVHCTYVGVYVSVLWITKMYSLDGTHTRFELLMETAEYLINCLIPLFGNYPVLPAPKHWFREWPFRAQSFSCFLCAGTINYFDILKMQISNGRRKSHLTFRDLFKFVTP